MEVVKIHYWECEDNNIRETSNEELEEEHNTSNKEDSVQTAAFAVGTFLLMVCLKRLLVEQWRAWVFLLLNVILLSIFFISTKTPRSGQSQSQSQQLKTHNKKDGELLDSSSSNSPTSSGKSKECSANNNAKEEEEDDEEEEEEEAATLSKEELNERVEAFIAMFRQHLISDVKQGFSFTQTTANLTNHPNKIQVSCC